MELFWDKIGLTTVLLVLTSLCCTAPWLVKKQLGSNFTTALKYMNTLAGGVVLGALLMHMIPELFEHSHAHHLEHSSNHISVHSHHHSHDGKHLHTHGAKHPHSHDQKQEHSGHSHDHKHNDHEHKPSHDSVQGHDEHGHKHNELSLWSIMFSNKHYPWGCLAAGISFLFLFYVDRIFFGPHGNHNHKHDEIHKHDHKHDNNEHHHDHSEGHCCNGHQGNGHQTIKKFDPKSVVIQISAPTNKPKESYEADRPPSHRSCHSHDLVGGCHMDSIQTSQSQSQTLLFVFALSLHSFLEGLGAASQHTRRGLIQFAFSLIGHKFLEAFALGVSVMRAKFGRGRTIAILSIYSLLTPAGIILGMAALAGNKGSGMVASCLNGAAVGSFLFVGLVEMIPPEFHSYDPVHSGPKFAVLCVGFFSMAIVSAVGHSH